ncbi:CU044_5270 family protein [Streptomyces sp. NPDC001970]
MSAAFRHSVPSEPAGPSEVAERADLALLLPSPTNPDLSADRRRLLKEHLMQEIDRSTAPAPVRRRRRPVLMLAAATACVAALTVGLGGIDALREPTNPTASAGAESRGEAAPPASPQTVQLLENIALAAHRAPVEQVRGDQYTYVRTSGFTTSLDGDTGKTAREDSAREEWVSVDGTGRTVLRGRGGGEQQVDAPGKGTLNAPTYQLLATLPTAPAALLEHIYADTTLNHGPGTDSTTGPDQEAFVMIGDLLRGVAAPPETSAALYRAAARIPGVVTVLGAVDAAGRRGVAVAREHDGERTEWIFDEKTLQLLGERTVLLEDSAWGKAGTAVTSTAVLDRGIVDRPGQTPRTKSGPA